MFQPNKLQKEVLTAVGTENDHLVVIARAGTGKTTTILEAAKTIPVGKSILLCAFNKSIQKELQDRAPSHVNVKTLHSLGFGCLCRQYKFKVDGEKTRKIVKDYLGKYDGPASRIGVLCRLVSLAKNTLADDIDSIEELAYEFGVEDEDNPAELLAELAVVILNRCKKDTATIDFDDMIWLPYVLKILPRCFDVVFVDEAQDLNACQRWMIEQTLRRGGRLIAVGDDRQAIYGWRGAGKDVLKDIEEKWKSKKLFLSSTFRCPKSVVKIAKEIVSDFESADDAPEGTVKRSSNEVLLKDAVPGDFVLSRTNAPLMRTCLELLKQGIPAQVAGREVGRTLINLIRRSKVDTVEELTKWLEKYETRERKRLLPDHEKAFETMCDKVSCINAFMEGEELVLSVIGRIERIFTDTVNGNCVVCSTVHKAKGLERDRVWLLESTFKVGKSIEEDNLYYVAVTRAKDTLVLVS